MWYHIGIPILSFRRLSGKYSTCMCPASFEASCILRIIQYVFADMCLLLSLEFLITTSWMLIFSWSIHSYFYTFACLHVITKHESLISAKQHAGFQIFQCLFKVYVCKNHTQFLFTLTCTRIFSWWGLGRATCKIFHRCQV